MPNFMTLGGTETCRQYGEMYTLHTFWICCMGASTEKKLLNHFKHLMA